MNNPHQNARTTAHSRALMVARRAAGRPVAQIAEEFGVSTRTVFKWLERHREGGEAALANRSSRPARFGAAHAGHWSDVAMHLRREYRLTGAEIAERLYLVRSTVSRWLKRAGIGRLKALEPREPPRRYHPLGGFEVNFSTSTKRGRMKKSARKYRDLDMQAPRRPIAAVLWAAIFAGAMLFTAGVGEAQDEQVVQAMYADPAGMLQAKGLEMSLAGTHSVVPVDVSGTAHGIPLGQIAVGVGGKHIGTYVSFVGAAVAVRGATGVSLAVPPEEVE